MGYKNIKHSILFSFLFWVGGVQSGHTQETAEQEAVPEMQTAVFTPPFNFPITFSGNFGEVRSNHFHGGLDFKIGGVIDEPVHALTDGHTSRIRVTYGSGHMLDVNYDSGYSTINHHPGAFTGDVARRVKELQYKEESWEVEVVPESGEYPVRVRQVITLSKNTGYSSGPHLHLDIIESTTRDYVDPLLSFMGRVKNNTAPHAEGIILFPQPGKGMVNGKQARQTLSASPAKPITAWGLVGMGIRAYGYMDGVDSRYGVHTVILEVDGAGMFRSVADRFAYEENRHINSWTHGQYMKSFVKPGNHLRMLHASNGNRGLIKINEERPYRLVYTLSDVLGNTSEVRLTVQDKNTAIRPVEHRGECAFRWDKTSCLQEPGLELVVPRGMLYDDVWLNYSIRAGSGDVAFTYWLNDTRIPMHGACETRISLHRDDLEDKSKYYVTGVTAEDGKYSVGGVYEDGSMKVRVRDLTTYTVVVDTVPPEIIPLDPQQWGRMGRIVFRAKDKETGVSSYRGTMDGKYTLFGKPNPINGNLVRELDPEHVKEDGRHTVEMAVTNGCGNQTVGQFRFI